MHDRLKKLNDLLHTAEQRADETKETASEADQLVRDLRAKVAAEKKNRRHLRGLTVVPVAVGTGVASAVAATRGHAVLTASAAAVATFIAGVFIGVTQRGPGHDEHHGAIPTAPARPAPSTSHPSPTASPTGPAPSPSPHPMMAPPSTMDEAAAMPPGTTPPGTSEPPSTPPPIDTSMPPVITSMPPRRHSRCVVILHLSAIQIRVLCSTNVT